MHPHRECLEQARSDPPALTGQERAPLGLGPAAELDLEAREGDGGRGAEARGAQGGAKILGAASVEGHLGVVAAFGVSRRCWYSLEEGAPTFGASPATLRRMRGLAPGLLAAAPSLRCPFFHHTLVLLVDHGDDGSFGFVLNKEAPLDFQGVAEELGLELADDRAREVPVLQGGPVSPETGWIVFEPQETSEVPGDVLTFASGLALTASVDMLHAMARGDLPRRALLTLGYAGWSPGQLEGEMREGSWIPVDLDPVLIFELSLEERWRVALESSGIDPGRVTTWTVPQA